MNNKLVTCTSTGCRLPEPLARDIDAIYKTLPTGCEYRRKAYVPDAIHFEPGERAEVSVITTDTVDKTNEVVIPSGVELDAYRRNPVVLWNHKSDEPPVAVAQWVKLHGETLRAKSVYPQRAVTKSDDDERPWYIDEVWDMVQSGVLKAKSIGFLPRKPMRGPTQEELELYPEWKNAGIWDEVMLLEYSVCPIGMNNDALVEAVSKGLSQEALKALGIEVQFPEPKVEQHTQEEAQAVVKCACEDKTMPLDEAIKRVLAIQTTRKKKRTKKSINWDEVIAREIERMKFNSRKILNLADEMYKNRGRV